jgi:hypothetical protein
MRRLLLVLVAAIVCATPPLGFCGDGVPDYGTEQCDSGMRCVSRANTLQWAGVGPSPGSIGITMSFQYAVQEYGGLGVPQPVYGMQLNSGILINQYQYQLVCDQVNASVISLTVEPVVADLVEWRLCRLVPMERIGSQCY